MRQHEAIVQLRAPADERLIVGRLPEPRDERAQQQLLRQAHARVRRHLERAQLHQPLPAAARFRRVELVDAELGAVRVAGHVDQQVAEDAIHQPRRRDSRRSGDLRERDLQLVERIVARLVHARMLARRADEQAREQVRQRRVVVPVAEQAAQQIGPPQERAVGRRRTAEDDVIAAAGAGVAAVEHELLGAEPRLPRLLVERRGLLNELVPVVRRMQVDFDDAGIRRHLEMVEPRIVLGRRAFDDDRHRQARRRLLDRRNQIEIVLGRPGPAA